jgi:hypothetical protein
MFELVKSRGVVAKTLKNSGEGEIGKRDGKKKAKNVIQGSRIAGERAYGLCERIETNPRLLNCVNASNKRKAATYLKIIFVMSMVCYRL